MKIIIKIARALSFPRMRLSDVHVSNLLRVILVGLRNAGDGSAKIKVAGSDLDSSRAISPRPYISPAIKAVELTTRVPLSTFESTTQLLPYRAILHGTLNIQMVLFPVTIFLRNR